MRRVGPCGSEACVSHRCLPCLHSVKPSKSKEPPGRRYSAAEEVLLQQKRQEHERAFKLHSSEILSFQKAKALNILSAIEALEALLKLSTLILRH